MSNPLHYDPPDTVRIGAKRFEQSPFYECYANSETVLGVAADRFYPAYNGEDIVETYWALRRRAVLFDVPEKPWQIEAGILDNLSDFDASMTPFEAGLGSFIDLDKDNFIGRDALLKADQQSLF